MRISVAELGENVISALEKELGETFRRSGLGKSNEQVVLRRDQWSRVHSLLEACADNPRINESSAVAVRAYVALIKNGGAAKTTPAGRVALIAAVLSMYNADPGMGSRLIFLLNM